MFGFRTRAPERDSATDADRRLRLQTLLGQLRSEIANERKGLTKRLEAVRAEASFAMMAEENSDDSHATTRLASLEQELTRAQARLLALERQTRELGEMECRWPLAAK